MKKSGSRAVTAVEEVDLSVDRGELVVIMGPPGSGKSTLLQLIGALMTPTSGDVLVNGRSLANRSPKALADIRLNEIGFILQTFNLLSSLSARENVALPASLAGKSRKDQIRRSNALLGDLGLGDRLTHRPEELSGGIVNLSVRVCGCARIVGCSTLQLAFLVTDSR